MTLNLKRVGNGYYERNIGDVRISISNPFVHLGEGSKAWQLWIEVEGNVLLDEWFDTKKQASTFGAQFINSL
tara:strand:- start:47 stop:262 length:216 start_codon:yes stop_codon:yes gene_type:complete